MAGTDMREFGLTARSLVTAMVAGLATGAAGGRCEAQLAQRLDLGGDLQVGGEAERYFRVLEISGDMPRIAWTIQPLARSTAAPLAPPDSHPWAVRFGLGRPLPAASWLRPEIRTILNSTFPVQERVGPVWAGRGATVAVQGGGRAQWGRLSVQLAPIAFIAQNASFPLASNGQAGDLGFGDARFPTTIDFPQRFGDRPHGRIDLGTSFVSLALPGLSLGVSNAPQRWGPSVEYPLILGPGGGGFPHYFIGTGKPIDLWIAALSARLIGGRLSESAFSAAGAGQARRFASAAVVSATPRGIAGLELGFIRFFESAQPATLRRALLPIGLAKFSGVGLDNDLAENQLASAFFRWTLPRAGAELYGEWLRDDFPGSVRKFALQPDNISTFMLGLQRVLVATPSARRVVRFEIVNGELSHQERGDHGASKPLPPYVHFLMVQGHTQRGLLLGSPEAYGGAGWRASWDEYTMAGRRSLTLERALRFDYLPGGPESADVHPDVMYAVRGELLRFAGGRDYGVTLAPAINLNRNLVRGNDRFNLHAMLSVRGW